MGLEERDILAQVHDYYRALIDNSVDLIMLMDAGAVFVFISPSVERVLGYTQEELLGTCSLDYVPPEVVDIVREQYGAFAAQPGAKGEFELQVLDRDGQVHYFESVGENLLERPGINGIVLNARDVTGHKKAEERLCETERRFKAIIDAIPEMVAISDGKGNIRHVGESVHQLMGYTREEAETVNLFDLIHPDDLEEVLTVSLDVAETPGNRASFTCRMRHGNGQWRYIEITGINLKEDPAIAGNLYVGRDVTESLGEDERLEAAMKTLFACASHELRQHVTILKGYSSLLLDHRNEIGEEELQRIYKAMKASSDRLNELAKGITYAEGF